MPLNFKFPRSSEPKTPSIDNTLDDENSYEYKDLDQHENNNKYSEDPSIESSGPPFLSSTFHSQVNFNNVKLVLPINIYSKSKILGI